MKAVTVFGVMALFGALSLAPAYASDFTGVYARIDKVVFEPSADAPERVQIWGVFSVSAPAVSAGYQPAARGYLYFKLDHNPASNQRWRDPARTLVEWKDLKALAGSGQIVAFGTRASGANPPPRVRKADEKPADPDFYTMNSDMVRVSGATDYPPIRSVADFKD